MSAAINPVDELGREFVFDEKLGFYCSFQSNNEGRHYPELIMF